LRARVPDIWVSVSATTRPPRPGETEGRDYFFLSPDEFRRRIDEDEFLEWAEVHGNRYGTMRGPVDRMVANGRQVILEIDVQGAEQVRRRALDATTIFIVAPSPEELLRRIHKRGAETEEQIATRMKTAEQEFQLVGKYDYVVINDDVSRATNELVCIIDSLSEE